VLKSRQLTWYIVITPRRVRKAEQVAGFGEKRNAYRILVWKYEELWNIWPMIGTKAGLL
jgi:hypothetical protein